MYYFPSSPVWYSATAVWKHKLIFVHGLIFLLQQYRLRLITPFEVVKSGVFVVEVNYGCVGRFHRGAHYKPMRRSGRQASFPFRKFQPSGNVPEL